MRLLPYLDGFRDELEKIAMLGTALGGAVGYGLTPGGIKNKVIGTLAGGALGAGTGSVLRKAKQVVIDEPEHRDRAALMNYTSHAQQLQNNSPYGPYVF